LSLAFWISAAMFATLVPGYLYVWRGSQSSPQLRDTAPSLGRPWPAASIVVAARNEEAGMEPALRSLLALDYPALEVIAIDDRSTDATPRIMERVAREHPQLRVLRVDDLPAGWLGKNHALHQGAQVARGEYLLFTDADVVLEPSVLKRAIAFCEARGLAHLSIFPDTPMRSTLLQAMMVNALIGLTAIYRPWRIPAPARDAVGAGAFNLVRTDAYRRAGGHEAIAFEVLDDVMLARLVAARAGPSAWIRGKGMGEIEIYRSAAEAARGAEKNTYTFLDYNFALLVVATMLMLAVYWPWVGLFVTDGAARWLNAGTLAAGLVFFAAFAREIGFGWRCLLWWPVIGLFMLGLMWRVVLRNVFSGTIVWRGTRYPLDEVRRRHREVLRMQGR